MLLTKHIPIHSSRFLFCKDNTMVSYIANKNKSVVLLSNYHHDSAIGDGVKQKPQIILDYNRYKCGVDVLDMMLEGHRPKRTTRRWLCIIFFDLIGMSQASYVLFCSKFVESDVSKKKKRREFLYNLGRELVIPEIRNRKATKSFSHLNKDVRLYIDELLNDNLPGNIIHSESSSLIPSLVIPSQSEHVEDSFLEPSEQHECFSNILSG